MLQPPYSTLLRLATRYCKRSTPTLALKPLCTGKPIVTSLDWTIIHPDIARNPPRRLCHRVLHPALDLPLCGSVTNRPFFLAACHSRARFIFNSSSSSSSFSSSLPVGGSALHYSNDLLTNTQATIVIERRPLFVRPTSSKNSRLAPPRIGRLCRIIQLPRSFAR